MLLVVDEYSRWREVYALDTTHAKQIVISSKDYFARFGVPELIRCDEGSSFTSAEFKTFIIHQGAALKYSPLYCPRSNGLVERFNQTIRNLLQTNIEDSRSWYDTLKSVLQTYRSTIHPALGKSPYEMVFGNKMRTKCTALLAKTSIQEFKQHKRLPWSLGAETKSFLKIRSRWLGSSERSNSTKKEIALQVLQAAENSRTN